jgi:thiol-disulfide isomerase/thioredoxin
MNLRTILVVSAIVGAIAFLVWGLASKSGESLATGSEVPSVPLESLPPDSGTNGKGSLADYRGEWVLMNVWASWCTPCRDESPALEKFSRRWNGEITVLGIDTRDITGDALAFIREFDLTFPQLRDPTGSYSDALGTTGVPESFLVDPEGRLTSRLRGPVRDYADIERFAEPAIGTSKGSGA